MKIEYAPHLGIVIKRKYYKREEEREQQLLSSSEVLWIGQGELL